MENQRSHSFKIGHKRMIDNNFMQTKDHGTEAFHCDNYQKIVTAVL